MMTIEDDLRAAFARHEAATPAADDLHDKINTAVVRRKRRRAITGAAAAVLAVGALLPVAVNGLHRPPALSTESSLMGQASAPVPVGGLNVLVIGTDRGLDGSGASAAAVMIAHVTSDLRRAYLVSLSPDGQVAGGGTLSGTYRAGGAAQTRRAVAGLTGLDFDATVTFDPATLSAVTDAVGGVEWCLNSGVVTRHPIGCERLEGADVVQMLHAQSATPGGDQRYLRALAEKATANGVLTDPAALQKLFSVADRHGLTIEGDLRYLLRAATSIRAADIVGVSAPGPQLGPSLYDALRRDDLAAWTAAHPAYVLKS